MIRDIVRDEEFLAVKSEKATADDMDVVQDLLDTFEEHSDECVGLAANMIGVSKRIIVFDNLGTTAVMLNPMIVDKKQPYITEEGCLSLDGERKTPRFKRIKVRYLDTDMKEHVETFTGWTAEIIQHEVDHCNGRVI